MSLNSLITAALSGTYTRTKNLAVASYTLDLRKNITLADGTGTNQADLLYRTIENGATLATGATITYDISPNTTLEVVGDSLPLVKVKGFLIYSYDTNTTNLTVGNAASNVWVGPFGASTHTLTIQPGGLVLIAAPQTGYTVTAATGDQLKIANAAGADALYDLVLIGTSA